MPATGARNAYNMSLGGPNPEDVATGVTGRVAYLDIVRPADYDEGRIRRFAPQHFARCELR
jgi:hypothetical protein